MKPVVRGALLERKRLLSAISSADSPKWCREDEARRAQREILRNADLLRAATDGAAEQDRIIAEAKREIAELDQILMDNGYVEPEASSE